MPEHIDLSNAGQIREQLLSLINRGAAVLIADMSGTVSCDHAGADIIGRAYQRAVSSGTELRLVIVSEIVRRVISISGVDRLVSVYPLLESCVAAGIPSGAGRARPGTGGMGSAAPDDPGADSDVGVEVALLDRDGVIVSVNDAWRTFAAANGGDPDRVSAGVSYLDVCAAATGDPVAGEVAEAIRRALAGDLPGPLEIEVPCHSLSTRRWFDMLVSPRRDDYGRPLGATVTLSLARSQPNAAGPGSAPPGRRPGSAVREAVRVAQAAGPRQSAFPQRADVLPAEEQLAAAQRSAAGAEAGAATRLAADIPVAAASRLADAVTDGVALADGDGRIMLANRQLADMFGYGPAELAGLPVESLLPAGLREAHRRHRAAYRQSPYDRPMADRPPLVGLRKDGSSFPVEISLAPVPGPGPGQGGTATLAVIRPALPARRASATPGDAARAQPAERTASGAGSGRDEEELLSRISNRLLGVGLRLQSGVRQQPDATRRVIGEALDILDDVLSEIRTAAFAARGPDFR